jgi:peptidoglycan/xylan/chitin deacetylase (PgdA/CDA1 family)
MLQDNQIQGDSLPAKTVSLTFDDGPAGSMGAFGPHSVELARFLKAENISATFFIVGEFAQTNLDLLKELASLGHLIGNHSFNHVSLTGVPPNSAIEQLCTTNALIRSIQMEQVILVRAPYGDWSSQLATALNTNFDIAVSNAGPIGWNVGGNDWECWRDGTSPDECADRYLLALHSRPNQNGIILSHDNTAESASLSEKNRTLEMMKRFVPLLKATGFKFVRCDEIAQVRAAMEPPNFTLSLASDRGPFVGSTKEGVIGLTSVEQEIVSWSALRTKSNGVVLKTRDNQYLSIIEPDSAHLTDSMHDAELFDAISIGEREILLRCKKSGMYLGFDLNNHVLTTDVSFSFYVNWL